MSGLFGPDFIFQIPALLITLTIHEYAHARMAVWLGDPTPRIAGRLTLNPIAHLDPIGLLAMVFTRFGWAKPVPFNPYNLRNGQRGAVMVALAGPGSNFLMAFVSLIAFYLLAAFGLPGTAKVAKFTYWFNLSFAVFNLIPLPPLDGSHFVSYFLPPRLAESYDRIASYGPFILIALVYLGVFGILLNPIIDLLNSFMHILVSIII